MPDEIFTKVTKNMMPDEIFTKVTKNVMPDDIEKSYRKFDAR